MKWKVLDQHQINIASKQQSEEIIKILLQNRGIKTKKEIEEFLSPTDPIKFKAKDLGIDEREIKKAVKRVLKAIKNNESIIVYGDYDADGICATAILWEALYRLTKNVLPYIPERVSEGYGLNNDSAKKLKAVDSRLKLIITVDHGITAAEKIKYAKKLEVDVIVCDHHQKPKKLPKCEAIIWTDKVSAAAIAYFLASKFQSFKVSKKSKTVDGSLSTVDTLGLVAIATIADLEPLVGINRSFAKYGLEQLKITKRPGLLAIFEEAGIKQKTIGTYEIGYIIAPRLNAMGRMEHALESLRLLCTKNVDLAKNLAEKLGGTNRERQLLTEETTKHAKLSSEFIVHSSKLIFIGHEDYNQGIIGLVAGRLVEEFYRPAIVLSIGEIYSKASARSITGFNIIEAIRAQSDLLVDAGGHPMAAGFTIETTKIEILKERLLKVAEEQIPEEALSRILRIDMELPFSLTSQDLWTEIQKMSPFGLGNPEPVFAGKAVLKDFRTVGTEGKHLKLVLSPCPNTPNTPNTPNIPNYSAIAFSLGHMAEKLKFDQEVEVAFTLSINEWNNEKKLELKIKDIK